MQDNSPLAFFGAMQGAFRHVIAQRGSQPTMVEHLLALAFSSFDGNVAIQAEGQPALACRKGCAACCRLRVTATAPEVLLIARFIRASAEQHQGQGIDLMQRVVEADADTRGLTEAERIARRRRCPFVDKGACAAYAVRTLACRGHASWDRRACIAAMSGDDGVIPVSQPHMMVRSLVQNALQSALRDGGYAWGIYELNHALQIALTDCSAEQHWLAGQDVFAEALVDEIDQGEMARIFDEINSRTH